MLGQARWELGERDSALETLWKAFNIDPWDHWYYYYLSPHLIGLGRWKGLLELFRYRMDNTSLDPHDRLRKRAERRRP